MTKTLGTVSLLIAETPASKQEIKAQALADVAFPLRYEYKGMSITIERTECEGKMVGVLATAEKDGKKYSDWHYFLNPPILVPDGTFETVIEEIPATENEDAQTYKKTIHNYIENPSEALKMIVGQTLETVKWPL
jgi:hypothetical protein